MGSRCKVWVLVACKKKMEKCLWRAFSWYRGKTLGSVSCRPWFPHLPSPVKVGMEPIVSRQAFQIRLLGLCREEMKPGPGVHSKRDEYLPEACECQKPCEALLRFHLAGRCSIETISPGISWDLRSCSFSYWVGWEQWPVHVRTGTDSFHFNAIKKKKTTTIPGPSPFTGLVPGAFPLHLSSQRCPDTWSIELSSFFSCSVLLLHFSSGQLDALVHKGSAVRARNVRLLFWMGFGQSVWILAFVWKR